MKADLLLLDDRSKEKKNENPRLVPNSKRETPIESPFC